MEPEGTENNIQKQSAQNQADSTKKIIKKEGIITEALPNASFKVLLDDGKEIIGFLSGKMRLHRIKILLGDKVTVEMTPYDDTKGRIVYRLK